MNETSKYKLEIKQLMENQTLSKDIVEEIKHFLEWNSMSITLQNLDRVSSLSFIQDSYKNSKVLAGSELEKKRINLYKANRKFIDFINEQNSDDISIRKIQQIFNMYLCLSVRILQEKKCLKYLDELIESISNSKVQQEVKKEFQTLSKIINENLLRANVTSKHTSKFIIERKTIEYFGITNFQIVNSLNRIGWEYQIEPSELGNLSIDFKKSKRELSILDMLIITTSKGIQLPIRKIGKLIDQ